MLRCVLTADQINSVVPDHIHSSIKSDQALLNEHLMTPTLCTWPQGDSTRFLHDFLQRKPDQHPRRVSYIVLLRSNIVLRYSISNANIFFKSFDLITQLFKCNRIFMNQLRTNWQNAFYKSIKCDKISRKTRGEKYSEIHYNDSFRWICERWNYLNYRRGQVLKLG